MIVVGNACSAMLWFVCDFDVQKHRKQIKVGESWGFRRSSSHDRCMIVRVCVMKFSDAYLFFGFSLRTISHARRRSVLMCA